tara:strand:- start:56 stop:562 length:507 start_codon:yes stop_codon:yes gene_type:complete
MEFVTIKTSDNKIYKIKYNIIKISIYLNSMISDNDFTENEIIPLLNINSKTFDLIITYCEYYENNQINEIPKPLKSHDLKLCGIGLWDIQFVENIYNTNNDFDVIFSLINAANFLNIKSLLDLMCAYIASKIKSKTPEEVRALFDIKLDDFNDEDLAELNENSSHKCE